jgi:hypothetical protein
VIAAICCCTSWWSRYTPFDGAGDVVSRLLVEQWVTFPRFVLSGGWGRNLRASR